MVIKVHAPDVLAKLVLLGVPDLVLTSNREPRGLLCSKARIFKPSELQNTAEQWSKACRGLMKLQLRLYQAVESRRGYGAAAQ